VTAPCNPGGRPRNDAPRFAMTPAEVAEAHALGLERERKLRQRIAALERELEWLRVSMVPRGVLTVLSPSRIIHSLSDAQGGLA
jgi:hypothetical protein